MSSSLRLGAEVAVTYHHSWFDQLLFEAGRDQGVIENNPLAPMDRHQGYGENGPVKASKNGGYLSYSYEIPEEFFDTLDQWTFGEMDQGKYPWSLLVLLHNLGGTVVDSVAAEDTPYRGRNAKLSCTSSTIGTKMIPKPMMT